MSSYDDIDREIDHEMGWDRGPGGKPRNDSIRRRPDYWQALLHTARATSPLFRGVKSVFRAIGKVVFYPIISPMSYSKRFNAQGDMVVLKRSIVWRLFDGLLTRLMLTPVIIAIFLIAVVYSSTHPRKLQALNTPDGFGMYFKKVSMVTVDNQRLSGWFIPPISAQDVTFDPEGVLMQKYPAVVICHGLGATHDQYLPLARTLNEAGFGVLMLDTRGQGDSDAAAVTYGLRERLDVLAAVKFLRETPYIDPQNVCVIGHDISAMAVLQAAALDTTIAAAVADGLWPRFEERASDIFARRDAIGARASAGQGSSGALPTRWLAPLYTLAFEIAVRDRLNQLDPEVVVRTIHNQPLLFIAREGADYCSVQDVLTLASLTPMKHDVITPSDANGNWEERTRDFLIKATKWKGSTAHAKEQIKSLMKYQVPKK